MDRRVLLFHAWLNTSLINCVTLERQQIPKNDQKLPDEAERDLILGLSLITIRPNSHFHLLLNCKCVEQDPLGTLKWLMHAKNA
jgi:hypothetical protein